MSASPDTKTQTEVLTYQNEVKKCHLMLHLKFDKVEEAKFRRKWIPMWDNKL